MRDSNYISEHPFIQLLKTFNEKEIKTFRNFLNSPYFNTRKQLITLYDELLVYYPEFTDVRLTKEKLHDAAVKSKGLKESTMRDLLSKLLKEAQNFLCFEKFKKSYQREYYLMEELINRKNSKLFLKNAKNTDQKLRNEKKLDYTYFYRKYLFEINMLNYFSTNDKMNSANVSKYIETLNGTSISLTVFCITELINQYQNYITMINRFEINKSKESMKNIIDCFDLDKFTHYIEENLEESVMIELYKQLYKSSNNIYNDEQYFIYKKKVEYSINQLSDDERVFHYSRLINFCIWKSKVDEEFKVELFNIYKLFLKSEFFKNTKYKFFQPALYRDILFLSLELKENTWAEKFIEAYSVYLPPDQSENLQSFAKAAFQFETGDYEKSFTNLQSINFDYFILKYDYRNLLLKLYYETSQIESGLSLVGSYNEFIKNDNILSEKIKKGHLNFIHFTEKLLLFKSDSLKKDIRDIISDIRHEKNISNNLWLLEKINEIESK